MTSNAAAKLCGLTLRGPEVIAARIHNGLLKTAGKNRNSTFDAIPRRQFQDYHEIHVFLSQEGSQIALQLFFWLCIAGAFTKFAIFENRFFC